MGHRGSARTRGTRYESQIPMFIFPSRRIKGAGKLFQERGSVNVIFSAWFSDDNRAKFPTLSALSRKRRLRKHYPHSGTREWW